MLQTHNHHKYASWACSESECACACDVKTILSIILLQIEIMRIARWCRRIFSYQSIYGQCNSAMWLTALLLTHTYIHIDLYIFVNDLNTLQYMCMCMCMCVGNYYGGRQRNWAHICGLAARCLANRSINSNFNHNCFFVVALNLHYFAIWLLCELLLFSFSFCSFGFGTPLCW